MAGDYRIEIQGLTELNFAFRNYPKISEPIFQKAIMATGAVFAKNTLKDNPVPWRTGNLLQSFRFRTGQLYAIWYPTANYAVFVNDGTKFQKANPYMQKIVNKSEAEVNKLFKEAGDMIHRQIALSTRP
jgi:hypothetical protein